MGGTLLALGAILIFRKPIVAKLFKKTEKPLTPNVHEPIKEIPVIEAEMVTTPKAPTKPLTPEEKALIPDAKVVSKDIEDTIGNILANDNNAFLKVKSVFLKLEKQINALTPNSDFSKFVKEAKNVLTPEEYNKFKQFTNLLKSNDGKGVLSNIVYDAKLFLRETINDFKKKPAELVDDLITILGSLPS